MSAARQQIRGPLEELLARLRNRQIQPDTGLMHALREYGAQCFELGRAAAYARHTVRAPDAQGAIDDDGVTGAYSLRDIEPDKV